MDDISSAELARLTDYLLRELAAGDIAAAERWISAHVEYQAFLEYLRQPQSARSIESFESEAIIAQRVDAVSRVVRTRMRPEPSIRGVEPPAKTAGVKPPGKFSRSGRSALLKRSPNVWRQMVVGVGLSLLCLAGIWYGMRRDHVTQPSSEKFVYMTAPGERATVRLTDGSVVVLNVASRLEVPANYGRERRMVHLDGEGLFTVVHQNHTPFTVTAGSSTTRVLGTTFAVRHYATDTTTRIAVRDGKVAVDSTIISAAQQLTMSSSGGGRLQAADPTVFAFATGKLVLERMFLKAAVPELDRWYNADIRFADSTIGHSQIEGSFLGGSPADLREQLSWSLGFRVVRDGRVLTIYRK
jgi:ferric-dicitrate binding protein FerR (iron transport regulator)